MNNRQNGNTAIAVLFIVLLGAGYFIWQRLDVSGERSSNEAEKASIYFRIKDACLVREKNLLKIPEGKSIEETYGLPVAKQIGEKCSKEADTEAERQTP